MDKVNITKVSCCGANEQMNIDETVKFITSNPNVEVGIGVSNGKCQIGMPRFNWIIALQDKLKEKGCSSQIALHVNGSWTKDIIEQGKLPKEIEYILLNNESPIRIQINAVGMGYNLNKMSSTLFAQLVKYFYQNNIARFILPANEDSFDFIRRLESDLKDYGDKFDILYDSSFGFGKKADKYVSYFSNHLQGYAGGLCGKNVQNEIIKINEIQNSPVDIWIDAEKRLACDYINTLSLVKAQEFVDKTLEMNKINSLDNSFLF